MIIRWSRLLSCRPRITFTRAVIPLVSALAGYLILPTLLAGMLPAPEVASARPLGFA